MSSPRVYNSRIVKVYLEFIREAYPDISAEDLLREAGMTRPQVEDTGHWFTQEEMDRFHETLVAHTKNPNISRDAGRYAASAKGMGPIRSYVLGLTSPLAAYKLMAKLYEMMSKGANIETRITGLKRVEIISRPSEGILEKQYQCENRLGTFESMARLFVQDYARIEHPECVHRGDRHCLYRVSWKTPRAARFKSIRNLFIWGSILSLPFIIPLLDSVALAMVIKGEIIVCASLYIAALLFERDALIHSLEEQRVNAVRELNELNERYNDALLVQEIGQATSHILSVRELSKRVVGIMKERLNFDRGAIWLFEGEKGLLEYASGYGYDENKEELLRATPFHVREGVEMGPFVEAFLRKVPITLNGLSRIKGRISERSLALAKEMEADSLVCVPLLYEDKALGILAVDNVITKNPLTQTDVNLLKGVASQIASAIAAARAFKKVEESERQYHGLVENASSVILRTKADGTVIFCNAFGNTLFGFNEGELLGKNIVDTFFGQEDPERAGVSLLMKESILLDRPVTRELVSKKRDGSEVYLNWTLKALKGDQMEDQEILWIGNDITELKAAEKEREKLLSQLERAQKMEMLGMLAGKVAHDLNNILIGLVSYPDLLLMRIPKESPLRKHIMTIKKSGEKAAGIVQDLLTLSRRGSAKKEVVNINKVVQEYLKSLEFQNLMSLHPGVRVSPALAQGLQNIEGFPLHLSKSLMNLVTNAVEAMPSGGDLRISTSNVSLGRDNTQGLPEGQYVLLEVSDTGEGIREEHLDKIFEPFFSTKGMGKSGTGLGMCVVWGTVQDHAGQITVRSKLGEGTTFSLYFPATQKGGPAPEGLKAVEAFRGRGERILVLDDDPEQREIVSSILTELGYQVSAVESGEAALEELKERPAGLVILDMVMKEGMDGLDTYKEILKLYPKQKAIIISGFSESDRVKEAQELGAGEYIKKPYLVQTLAMAVRNHLDS